MISWCRHERPFSGRLFTPNAFSVDFAPFRTAVKIRGESMTPAPRLALATVFANVAYLGLVILGWGGLTAFFSCPHNCSLRSAWRKSGYGCPHHIIASIKQAP